MKNFKIMAAILLIFLMGILVGVFGNSLYMSHKMRQSFRMGPGAMIGKRIVSQLDLTAEQRKNIEAISKDINTSMIRFFNTHRDEGERIVEEGFTRMKEYLDPEQRQELDRLHQRLKNRHPFPPHTKPPGMPDHRPEPDPPF